MNHEAIYNLYPQVVMIDDSKGAFDANGNQVEILDQAVALEDARLAQLAEKKKRIAELKQLLAETDYVALSDYDKDKPEVIAQRAAWRTEIRELEA